LGTFSEPVPHNKDSICIKHITNLKGNPMKYLLSLASFRFAVAVATGLAASTTSSHAQGASATISDVAVSGGYDYTITLLNSGPDSLKSFWYGWTTDGNNLPSNPSNAGNSLGWVNVLDGNSIQWGNSSSTALAPGLSGTFTFFSTSTPSAITTSPSGESVAYVGAIDFSQGSPGDSTPIFSPTLVSAPEPSAGILLPIGLLVLAGLRSMRLTPRPE
jgi:hypothetical protein